MQQEERSGKFQTIVAVLIALVAVSAAVVAWRSAMVSSAASDAHEEGIINTVKWEAAATEDVRYLYQEADYANMYVSLMERADLLNEQATRFLGEGKADEALEAQAQALVYQTLASNLAGFSPMTTDSRYRGEDGTFNLEARLADLRAENQDLVDLDPAASFNEADKRLAESRVLTAMIVFLTGTLLFYTLAEIIESRLKYVFVAVGSMTFLGTLAAVTIAEAYFLLF